MEGPPALARLRAVAGQLDAPGAVAFMLHCFLDEELAGGAFERETAGVVETVKYACGVQMQTVPMGGSLAVHVLKPGCKPLHWVLLVSDFAPAWSDGDAAENLAGGVAKLRQAFDVHIGSPLAELSAAAPTSPAVLPQAAAPTVVAAETHARARSSLQDPGDLFGPLEPSPSERLWYRQPEPGPGRIHTPGAGLLGELEAPLGDGAGMLIGPGHPGFDVGIGPGGGGMAAHGPDGAPMPGARWDPIHGQGRLGDPDAGHGGDADLHQQPSGIDDTDVDSMFM